MQSNSIPPQPPIEITILDNALLLRCCKGSLVFFGCIGEVDEKCMQRKGDRITVRLTDDSAYVCFTAAQLGGSLEGARLFTTKSYVVCVRGNRFWYEFIGAEGRENCGYESHFVRMTLGFDNDGNLCWYTKWLGTVIVQLNSARA